MTRQEFKLLTGSTSLEQWLQYLLAMEYQDLDSLPFEVLKNSRLVLQDGSANFTWNLSKHWWDMLNASPKKEGVPPVKGGLTTDPGDPRLLKTGQDGQQLAYLVLSEEERNRGFVRPVRQTYRHVGIKPSGKLRPLTEKEKERYAQYNYIGFEEYGPERSPRTGRFWTEQDLDSGCNCTTTMSMAIAETYSSNPCFYGSTFCCHCGKHFPVEQFVWEKDGSRVGS